MKAVLNARQGDVNFYKIDEFPAGDRIKDKQCQTKILAYGELSGHCHEVESPSVELFKIMSNLYMEAKEDVIVRHGKIKGYKGKEADQDYHNEITLPKGKYFIGIVEETDHIEKVSKKVID